MLRYLLPFFFIISGGNVLSQVSYINIAPSEGLDHTAYLAMFGVGASFVDINDDGLDDLSLCSSAGDSVKFYLNTGSGFSEIVPSLIPDVSESKTILWVDYDNDGDKDIFLCYFRGGIKLYQNSGGLTFSDVSSTSNLPSGLEHPFFEYGLQGLSAADYDHDGWTDLFASYRGGDNILMRNNGDGTFSDKTVEAGLVDGGTLSFCSGFFDYNLDGLIDIYVSNDKTDPNILYKNNGDGTFADESAASSTNVVIDAMCVAVGDVDYDEDEELFITNNFFGNVLLDNNADGTFTDISVTQNATMNNFGWAATFFDYDLDTDLDLYVSATGYAAFNEGNALWENATDSFYKAATNLELEETDRYSHAYGDINNDGYLDLLVAGISGNPMQLWQASGPGGNWLKVEPEGTISNRDGIGSVVKVYSDGNTLMRTHHCGLGYLGQNATYMHWGLGPENKVDSMNVFWPSGAIDHYGELCANRKLDILEGDPQSILPSVDIEGGVLNVDEEWDSYTWYLDGSPIAGSNSISYTPTENGSYHVILEDTYGCSQMSDTIFVELSGCGPSSIIENLGAISNPAGTTVLLSWSPLPGADFYQAKGRRFGTIPFGSFVTANTSKTVGNLIPGLPYEWKIRARCEGTLEITPFTPLSMFTMNEAGSKISSDSAVEDFILFPNPAADMLYLRSLHSDQVPDSYTIISEDGRVMKEISQDPEFITGQISINISLLSPGSYNLVLFGKKLNVMTSIPFVRK